MGLCGWACAPSAPQGLEVKLFWLCFAKWHSIRRKTICFLVCLCFFVIFLCSSLDFVNILVFPRVLQNLWISGQKHPGFILVFYWFQAVSAWSAQPLWRRWKSLRVIGSSQQQWQFPTPRGPRGNFYSNFFWRGGVFKNLKHPISTTRYIVNDIISLSILGFWIKCPFLLIATP